MDQLTMAMANYLRAVQQLTKTGKGTRITDIATLMKITKPSACNAITKLAKAGFVYRDRNRMIYLTAQGAQEANRVTDNFNVIYSFLTRHLHITSHIARIDAGKMEHLISGETIDALRSLVV